jgi:hypothetical protein
MKKIIILVMAVFLSYSFLSQMAGASQSEDLTAGTLEEIRNYDNDRQVIMRILKETVGGQNTTLEKDNFMALHTCVGEEAGISFVCNPNWKLSRQGKTLNILLSLIPRVEIIIGEKDTNLHFLSELSREGISNLGRFEEGFDVEHIVQCNRETIKVAGLLKDDSQTKVLAYFMIDHLNLHSVQFTVKPKEEWPQYEGLIAKVIDSLEFTGRESGVNLKLNPTDENCEDIVEPQ